MRRGVRHDESTRTSGRGGGGCARRPGALGGSFFVLGLMLRPLLLQPFSRSDADVARRGARVDVGVVVLELGHGLLQVVDEGLLRVLGDEGAWESAGCGRRQYMPRLAAAGERVVCGPRIRYALRTLELDDAVEEDAGGRRQVRQSRQKVHLSADGALAEDGWRPYNRSLLSRVLRSPDLHSSSTVSLCFWGTGGDKCVG